MIALKKRLFNISFAVIAKILELIPKHLYSFFYTFKVRLLLSAYWKSRLGSCGKGCIFREGIVIHAPENLFVGDYVSFGERVHIYATGGGAYW